MDKDLARQFYIEGAKRAYAEVLSYGFELGIKMPWVARRYREQFRELHFTNEFHLDDKEDDE